MDWPAYKALCDRPDYWSRWMLTACSELFAQAGEHRLAERLTAAMAVAPVAKPADHKGPADTDMFQLQLCIDERLRGLCIVETALQQGWRGQLTRSRGLQGFVEAWREYAAYSDQGMASA